MKPINYDFILICLLVAGVSYQVDAQEGNLDISFSSDGIVTTEIGDDHDLGYSVAIQADGRIVVAGYSYNGDNGDFALVRYNTDGSLDNTFSTDGKLTTDLGDSSQHAYAVLIQNDGKILLSGTTSSSYHSDFALVRYNSDGTLDSTFSEDGIVTTDFESHSDEGVALAIQVDGKIVVAGESGEYSHFDFALARYNADGSLDSTFSFDGKVRTDLEYEDNNGKSVAIQSDGKIVVAGNTFFENHYEFAICRYNTDGSLDISFSQDGKVITDVGHADDYGQSVAIQDDGKIVVVGSGGNSPQYFDIVRYENDGSLDSTFSSDGIQNVEFGNGNASAYSVAIQVDGKIIVVGNSWDGYEDFALIRCNSDGTADNSFSYNGKTNTSIGNFNDYASSVALQSDGKIVVAGRTDNGNDYDFVVARYIGYNNVGIETLLDQNVFTAFPNPSSGIFQINLPTEFHSENNIIITNLLGQQILTRISGSGKNSANKTSMESFDFSNQEKGVYIVFVENENGIVQTKIVIE